MLFLSGIVRRIEHFDWLVTSCKGYIREAAAQFSQIAPLVARPIISDLIGMMSSTNQDHNFYKEF